MNTNRREFLGVGAGAVAIPATLRSLETPTLAAKIAEYELAFAAYNTAVEKNEDHPDLKHLEEAEYAALNALCAHPISSIEDARAKATVFLEYVEYFSLPEKFYALFLNSFFPRG